VQASVDAGQTSDENRKSPAPIPEPVKEPDSVQPATPAAVTPEPAATVPKSDKWLLAIDLSYFVRATFSMAGIDTATSVEASTVRLIKRLKASNNLTDVVCCLDSANSFRKDLTKDWEHPYKFSRVEKEQELNDQLRNTIELLTKRNVPCVSVDGFEADDVMASYAVKFDGKVTLYTKDKDLRQCLSDRCNMLTEVTWETHPETGAPVPKYEFVTSKSHVEKGLTYQSGHVDGITPALWPHFQAIAGDSGDNIKGAVGIGPAIAVKLIREYKTVQGVIAACKDKTADLSDKKLLAILDFEPFAETTLKLTTMVNTLNVPMITTIAIKD
jgi:DNA polymerase-1